MYIMLILFGIETSQYLLTLYLCYRLKKSVKKDERMSEYRTESRADEILDRHDE